MELIEQAEAYMEQHYMDMELSQAQVAAQIGISTGYLSGLYKKERGQNFIETLTRIRMGHAMELMQQTDWKNYEIAEKTGFGNPHYFSISFKKFSGMSPSEFRGRNRR
jgi:two-component system response regulator YesN